MLVSRPGLGLETVQDHFLVVLVLVSIGPVLVLVLVLTGLVLVLVSDVPVLITSLDYAIVRWLGFLRGSVGKEVKSY
jgi:hypothetical protein